MAKCFAQIQSDCHNACMNCVNSIDINKIKYITIFREEATSALAGFHAGPLSWSNWNLEMLVFVEV